MKGSAPCKALPENLLAMAPKAGTYKIINNIFTDRVVDLADNDTSPGNPIIGYDWHGGDNQQASVLGR